jgi:hypothetical protein
MRKREQKIGSNLKRMLAFGLVLAAFLASPVASGQQKPTLNQLEQQAKERLEADRRRRQELETQALERQRLEAAEAIARQQREAAAAAEAAEAENQRLLIQSAKDKAREERTPVVKGDSLVCPSGEYRRKAARLVDIRRPDITRDGGVLGSYSGTRYIDGPPFGWLFLPDYWTKPPVRAFVLRNADSTRRVKEPENQFNYSMSNDPSLVVAEPELKALAEMVSEKFLLLGKRSGEFGQRFSLIGRSGDDHDLFVSMEQIALTTKGKVSAIWNRDTDGNQLHLDRPLYLCIDGMLQERILIDLFATTVDQFGAREKTSPYSVLIVTDIPFTEVTAAAEQFEFGMRLIDNDKNRNFIEAEKWFRKSAMQGFAPAQTAVGWLHFNGHGVSRDYVEAAQWFQKATAQGVAEAQKFLGEMYFNGVGVEQSYATAEKLIRASAEQGHSPAQGFLGYMHLYGRGVDKSISKARLWFERGASNDAWSRYQLGKTYYAGSEFDSVDDTARAKSYWQGVIGSTSDSHWIRKFAVVGLQCIVEGKSSRECSRLRCSIEGRADCPDP